MKKLGVAPRPSARRLGADRPRVVVIGSATKEDFALASTGRDEPVTTKLEVLLEAARRANWDAIHGPRHLRAGRFRVETMRDTAQQGVAVDGASRRR